ncbi:hypothetical protein GCM10009020_21080 [Natronoarchaeum mannanilyticum]|uniref:Arylsulfotransferase (ASST) n=2 Tax=Natronoarchaeum mannanilyticum TaxID=926360 RepID=A0AAV3TAF3_9EURY
MEAEGTVTRDDASPSGSDGSPMDSVQTALDRGRKAIASGRAHLSRNRLRVAFVVVLLLCAGVLAYGAANATTTANAEAVPEAPETENHTVVTESGRYGTITAFEPNGSLQYYNNSHTKYFDVDPVEGESMTVEYAATDTIHTSGPNCRSPPCARNILERANLSTGETEVIYERMDHRETAAEWHDVDRINETHVVVADMVADQIFVVNTETEIITWMWDAQSEFPLDEGGAYPGDWAHLNDVEVLPDGRIMASLRNQDQVVFINRSTGLQEDWTLGAEDEYDVQYEQHNPDYIPEERGGPAVVVADSENGRVQEFQREDGEWVRTWQWADEQMQWPRDADRLPNGNTLIADSNGKRVVEVAPDGDIVWEVPMSLPYDVERLETGDESAGGHSAQELGLESQTVEESEESGGGTFGFDPFDRVESTVAGLVPHRIHNGIVYISPVWMGDTEFGAAFVAILAALSWIGLESRWKLRDAGVGFRSPVTRRGGS